MFVPSPLRRLEGPAPLVVALHGCTQTASDFAAGTRFDSVAERVGAYVLYPEQSVRANPQRCWNWFLTSNQSRAAGEPAAIVSLVNDVVARHPIDRDQIFVAGLSAGGAMAAILAEQAPDVFAAVGIAAGVPLHATHDVDSAYAVMGGELDPLHLRRGLPPARYARLRASIWTGSDDTVVIPVNANRLAQQFLALIGLEGRPPARARDGDADVERWSDPSGRVRVEAWRVEGMGHAWSGGSFRGSHTHPRGPRTTDALMSFFLADRPAQDRSTAV